MHGEVRSGTLWLCGIHFLSQPAQWQAISVALNRRQAIVSYLQHAIRTDPVQWATGRAEMAVAAMTGLGRPDLAPGLVTLEHKGKDRLSGAETITRVQRDERVSIAIWTKRLWETLARECVEEASGSKAPGESWAHSAGLMGGSNE